MEKSTATSMNTGMNAPPPNATKQTSPTTGSACSRASISTPRCAYRAGYGGTIMTTTSIVLAATAYVLIVTALCAVCRWGAGCDRSIEEIIRREEEEEEER